MEAKKSEQIEFLQDQRRHLVGGLNSAREMLEAEGVRHDKALLRIRRLIDDTVEEADVQCDEFDARHR